MNDDIQSVINTPEYKQWFNTTGKQLKAYGYSDDNIVKSYINATSNKSTENTTETYVAPRIKKPVSIDTTIQNTSAKSDAIKVTPADRKVEITNTKSPIIDALKGDMNALGYQSYKKNIKDIQDIATTYSPIYKEFSNYKWFNLTDKDWTDIAANFKVYSQQNGEEAGIQRINTLIEKKVKEQMPWYETTLRSGSGFFTMLTGSLVTTAGMLYGMGPKSTVDFITGKYNDVEGMDLFNNYLHGIFNNGISNYGNNIINTGSFLPNSQEKQKETGYAANYIPLADADPWNLTDPKALASIVQQQGFTAAAIIQGAGLNKIFGWAFKGINYLTKGNRIAAAVDAHGTMDMLKVANKYLLNMQKIQKGVYGFVTPGLVGMNEGVVEAKATEDQVLSQGESDVNARIQSEIMEEYNKRLAEAKKYEKMNIIKTPDGGTKMVSNVDPKQILADVIDEYRGKYKESLDQVKYAAAKAGVANLGFNSLINGFMNLTLKQALNSAPTRKALSQFRILRSKPKLNVTNTPNGPEVTSRSLSKPIKYLNYAKAAGKEVLGEATEEGLQSISNDASQAAAMWNITKFMDNKLNGDSTAQIGDAMGGEWSALVRGAVESLSKKETWDSAIVGGLSSAFGSPLSQFQKYSNSKQFAEDWKNKKFWGRVNMILGYRNPIIDAIREQKAENRETEDLIKNVKEWLTDPKNRAKFDGATGTISWLEEMNRQLKEGDTFGYKNSKLGKLINDAFMLDAIKDTDFYESLMTQLKDAAYMEEGSEEAARYVEEIKRNAPNDSRSDTEIVEQGNKNATRMLEILQNINEENENITDALGESTDNDLRQTLIYGKLQLQDWENRKIQMENDIKNATANIEDSKKSASVVADNELLNLYLQKGSLQTIREDIEKRRKKIEYLKKNIEKAKQLKDAKRVAKKKEELEKLEKEDKKNEELDNKILNSKEEDSILNESQILGLTYTQRASMLNSENKKKFSTEQQAVIDNILNTATAIDSEFTDKILDQAAVYSAARNYLMQYNELLKNPESFSKIVYAAKRARTRALMAKRIETLSNIDNYKDFYTAYKEALTEYMQRGDLESVVTLDRELQRTKASAFLNKINENVDRQDAMNKALTVKDTKEGKSVDRHSVEQRRIASFMLDYLHDKGVDIKDYDSIYNTITNDLTPIPHIDDNNIIHTEDSPLKKAVDNYNKTVSADMKINYDDISQVLPLLKYAYDKVEEDNRRKESDNNPKPITPVIDNNPAPRIETTPTPTPTEEEEKQEEKDEKDNKEERQGGSLLDRLRNSNNDIIATISTKLDSAASNLLSQLMQKLNDNDAITKVKEDFIDALKTAYDNNSTDITNLSELNKFLEDTVFPIMNADYVKGIQNVYNPLYNKALEDKTKQERTRQEKAKQEKESTNNDDATKNSLYYIENFLSKVGEFFKNRQFFGEIFANPDNGNVLSHSIEYLANLKDNNNDAIIAQYIKKYHITEFLNDVNSQNIFNGRSVYFYRPSKLTTEEARKEAEKYGYSPIVALVKANLQNTDLSHLVLINGTVYQPIAIMPEYRERNGKMEIDRQEFGWFKGSNRLNVFEEDKNTDALLTKDGEVITWKTNSAVAIQPTKVFEEQKSKAKQEFNEKGQSYYYEYGDNNTIEPTGQMAVLDVLHNTYNLSPTTIDLILKNFYKQVHWDGQQYYYSVNKRNKNKNDNTFNEKLWLRHLDVVLLKDGSRLIDALFNKSEKIFEKEVGVKTLIDLNTRFNKAIKNGKSIEELKKILHRYLFFNDNVIKLEENKNGEFQISIATTSDNSEIVYKSKFEDLSIIDILHNVLFTADGKVRNKYDVKDNKAPIIDFNLPSYLADSTDNEDIERFTDLIKDGILEMNQTRLNYNVQSILFTYNNNSNKSKPKEKSNPDNANDDSLTSDTESVSNGAIIDTSSSITTGGTYNQKEQESAGITKAKNIINKIREKSVKLDNPNAETYHDKAQKEYIRVTSLLKSTFEKQSEEDKQNLEKYKAVSTTIGNTVDILVRTAFSNTVPEIGVDYIKIEGINNGEPIYFDKTCRNLTGAQIRDFYNTIRTIKNHLEIDKHLTVVPWDITLSGIETVIREDGTKQIVDLAGTVDLLAYDEEGNFYIYDIKTVHNGNGYKLDNNAKKWEAQLNLYKKMLEAEGGTVKEIAILPFRVEYENPEKNDTYTEENGELKKNNINFTIKTPELIHTNKQDKNDPFYRGVNIVDNLQFKEENMSEEDKALFNRLYPKTTETKESETKESPNPALIEDTTLIVELNTKRAILRRKNQAMRKRRQNNNIPLSDTERELDSYTEETKTYLAKALGCSVDQLKDNWLILPKEERDRFKNCLGIK